MFGSHLIFQELGRYNFTLNVKLKTIEKYMRFIIEQPNEVGCGLPFVVIASVHFLNNSLGNLAKNIG